MASPGKRQPKPTTAMGSILSGVGAPMMDAVSSRQTDGKGCYSQPISRRKRAVSFGKDGGVMEDGWLEVQDPGKTE